MGILFIFLNVIQKYYLYISVGIFALILRLINLGNPRVFSMDEAYYVPDSASILKYGYETYWGKRAEIPDEIAEQLLNNSWSNTLTYDASHPPLGKLVIAVGMFFFGTDNPIGWRISAAVCGTLVVILSMVLAYFIFKNKIVSLVSGFVMAIDPMAIAMSKTAHLDIFLTMFVLLGIIFGLLFYQNKKRIYLVLSFSVLGLALGVKWSAVYYIAVLFILFVVLAYRESKKVDFKNILLMAASSVSGYLLTWVVWFIYFPKETFFDKIVFLIKNHLHLYERLSGIDSPHNYKSNAFEWIVQSHPTLLYKEMNNGLVSAVSSMPNIVLWYGAIISLIFFAFMFFVKKVKVQYFSFLLVGIGAGWLPWMLVGDRTIFQYYTIVFQPYLYISLSFFIFILYKYFITKRNWLGLLGRTALLAYIFVSIVISFRLYNGAVGLEEPKDNGSWAIFTTWQNANKEIGLYNIEQAE